MASPSQNEKIDQEKKAVCDDGDEIHIYFNRRLKVIRGIKPKTTFGDIIAAILVSEAKCADVRIDPVEGYVICERVERKKQTCLESTANVREHLTRLKELTNASSRRKLKIRHTMQLKASVCRDDHVVSVNRHRIESSASDESLSKMSLKRALKKFEKHIDERKEYIKLLEDYLDILEWFECNGRISTQLAILNFDSATNEIGFEPITSRIERFLLSDSYSFATYV